METILLGVIANILRTYAVFRFMKLLYAPQKGNHVLQNSTYILFIVLTSGGYYLFHNQYVNILTNMVGLVLIAITYQNTFMKNILVVLTVYSVNIVIESFVFSVVNVFKEMHMIYESVNECFTSMGILIFVIFLEKTKAIKNKEFQISISLWICLISVPLMSIMIILVLLYWTGPIEKGIEIEIMGVLIINLVIFYLYGAIQDYYIQKVEKEDFHNKMEVYSNQLEVMSVSYQKMKVLRHDMKHHLIELRYLATEGNSQQLTDYIEQMEKYMLNTKEYVSSGSKDIDGTMNYLLQKAKQTLEVVEVDIVIPEGLEIHNYMFNVVLGNLLENAIEAAQDTERKYIKVCIKLKQSLIYVTVENSFNGEIKLEDNKIVTIKRKKENHGIGLKSVEKMIEEMNGVLNIKWEDHVFSVNAMFYLSDIGIDG